MSQAEWQGATAAALRRQDWAEAEQRARAVLAVHPTAAQAWVFLGEALEHQGHPAAAWWCFDRAWMLDPQAAWVSAVMPRLAAVRHRAPPPWLAELLAVPPVRVVAAVLARNEADNIERCLAALQPAVDAIVVVDTGSTDGTAALARRAGAEVLEVPWTDDFGAARRAADGAFGDEGWVLWVDADEVLHPDDVAVPRILAGLYAAAAEPVVIRVVQVNRIAGRVRPRYDIVRLFPLGRGLTWRGRVHEQVVGPAGGPPMRIAAARIRLEHWGYDPAVMAQRGTTARNLRLLRLWIEEEPDNPAAWGFLGRELYVAGRLEEAVTALERAEDLGRRDPGFGRLVEVRVLLCEALVRLRRWEAAQAVAARAVTAHPDHPAAWYWQAQVALLHGLDQVRRALESAQRAQALGATYRGFVSADPEVVQFLAPAVEADALRLLGRWTDAWARYRALAAARPDHAGVQAHLERMANQVRQLAAWVAAPVPSAGAPGAPGGRRTP
ncbi:MAG: tetratricopeptide repeat protein [Actinomycetia bacterium]|nr:tetratricopeptide repeat protein [Actinomycetes bacterium]